MNSNRNTQRQVDARGTQCFNASFLPHRTCSYGTQHWPHLFTSHSLREGQKMLSRHYWPKIVRDKMKNKEVGASSQARIDSQQSFKLLCILCICCSAWVTTKIRRCQLSTALSIYRSDTHRHTRVTRVPVDVKPVAAVVMAHDIHSSWEDKWSPNFREITQFIEVMRRWIAAFGCGGVWISERAGFQWVKNKKISRPHTWDNAARQREEHLNEWTHCFPSLVPQCLS